MRMIGPETIRKYEDFKQQIFGRKKDQFKQKLRKQTKKPVNNLSYSNNPSNHPFFRKISLLAILGIGFYIANEKFHLIHQALTYLDSIQINPITKSAITSVYSDMTRRLRANSEQHTLNERANSHFANTCFISQLKFHLRSLSEVNVPRTLSEETSSRFSFGPFKFGCKSNKLYISSQGNVVRESKYSKFNVGSVGFIGSKIQEIIQYESNVSLFSNIEEPDLQGICRTINIANYYIQSTQNYQNIYKQCVEKSRNIYSNIRQKVEKQKKINQRGSVKSRYFISLS